MNIFSIFVFLSIASCRSVRSEETERIDVKPNKDINFYGFVNSKSNCSNGVEYTFYGYNIDYVLQRVTLRKFTDKECKSEPYGELEVVYDLASPGINDEINWMIRLKLLNLTFVPLTNESFYFKKYCTEYRVEDEKIDVLSFCRHFRFNEVFILPKYYCHEVVVQKSDEKQHQTITKLYYYCLDNQDGYKGDRRIEYDPLFTSETIITFKDEPKLVTDEEKEKECDLSVIAIYILGFILTISVLAVIIRYIRSRRKKKENESILNVDGIEEV